MSFAYQVWQWFGGFLAVLLVAVVLNELFGAFPSVSNYIQTSVLTTTLYILVPSGITVILYILYDDNGF